MNSSHSNAKRGPTSVIEEPMNAIQIAGFRKMSVGRKLEIIMMMREAGIDLRMTGLRMRHPDWPPEKTETEARRAAMYASTD
jgi:hypothetical protein